MSTKAKTNPLSSKSSFPSLLFLGVAAVVLGHSVIGCILILNAALVGIINHRNAKPRLKYSKLTEAIEVFSECCFSSLFVALAFTMDWSSIVGMIVGIVLGAIGLLLAVGSLMQLITLFFKRWGSS